MFKSRAKCKEHCFCCFVVNNNMLSLLYSFHTIVCLKRGTGGGIPPTHFTGNFYRLITCSMQTKWIVYEARTAVLQNEMKFEHTHAFDNSSSINIIGAHVSLYLGIGDETVHYALAQRLCCSLMMWILILASPHFDNSRMCRNNNNRIK